MLDANVALNISLAIWSRRVSLSYKKSHLFSKPTLAQVLRILGRETAALVHNEGLYLVWCARVYGREGRRCLGKLGP
jgi:hypothetical protein